jgi:sulfhydrogenase subunit beta (sulfur reductase)
MNDKNLIIGSTVALPKAELNGLLKALQEQGYQTIGPRIKDEGIVYAEIQDMQDLPRGMCSDQQPASYRLTKTDEERYFDFIPAAQSWKQFLFPSRTHLFTARKDGKWTIEENKEPAPKLALVGVRACELAAITIQDKVFIREDFTDPVYHDRREGLFIIAVNCLYPDSTCFCTSMGTGPQHREGYDLCLTELDDAFLVQVGSDLGRVLLSNVHYELASAFKQASASQAIEQAVGRISRTLDTSDLPDLLLKNLEAKRWDEVAKRCLSCANCTQVCPTCFCWDVTDDVNVTGTLNRRERIWDSCFNPNFSYLFGGNLRPSIRSRYRQWLSHKLGSWKNQFGMLGCVGCGRCITWCPAGIDLTEEVAAIRREVNA